MSSTNQKLPQQDLKCPRFLQHSFSNKIIPGDYLTLQVKLERVRLTVPTHQLEMELRQYEWRQKTELPIIKITNHQIT